MLGSELRPGEMKIVVYHIQSRMAKYLLERKDATIKQVIYSKGVTAQMSVQTFNTGTPG